MTLCPDAHTSFTLGHNCGKFDCQTMLLAKESLLALIKRSPKLFDTELDLVHTMRLSWAKPQRSPLGK